MPDIAVLDELYFATVRAMGAELEGVSEALTTELGHAGYHPVPISVSHLLHEIHPLRGALDATTELRRYETRMRAGDRLREMTEPSAMAALAVREVARLREGARKEALDRGARGIAYLIRSLMHPAEVRLLRDLYGARFFLIAVFAPHYQRYIKLAREFAADFDKSHDPRLSPEQRGREIEVLLARDQGNTTWNRLLFDRHELAAHVDKHSRLSVSDTYQYADFFVSTKDDYVRMNNQEPTYVHAIRRFVRLIFGDPFETPFPDELGMAHAYVASRDSASLGRQVGAAICTPMGDLVATGMNEVPRPGGGQYRNMPDQDTVVDGRDHISGYDISDIIRIEIFQDLMSRLLSDPAWLAHLLRESGLEDDANADDLRDLIDRHFADTAQGGVDAIIRVALRSTTIADARMFDVIEFGRALHAEMSAIFSAADRGYSVRGATLYVTTFPCHECTRHIIAAGIERVVYVEPYSKSQAARLHPDAVVVGDEEALHAEHSDEPTTWPPRQSRVRYDTFTGISSRRLEDLFSFVEKKVSARAADDQDGRAGFIVDWAFGPTTLLRPSIAATSKFAFETRMSALLTDEHTVVDQLRQQLAMHGAYFDNEGPPAPRLFA